MRQDDATPENSSFTSLLDIQHQINQIQTLERILYELQAGWKRSQSYQWLRSDAFLAIVNYLGKYTDANTPSTSSEFDPGAKDSMLFLQVSSRCGRGCVAIIMSASCGLGMGTACAPPIAQLFMHELERNAMLSRIPWPVVGTRYLDDVFMLCKGEQYTLSAFTVVSFNDKVLTCEWMAHLRGSCQLIAHTQPLAT